jgi:molybdopterin-containing oxidoreductase family iron-sulfur binding subunit
MVTACQAACPTKAIHFGNLNDEKADVSRLKHAPHHYTLLAELNTRPRTTYLKRVYNSDDGE